jgi:hypothetical protein
MSKLGEIDKFGRMSEGKVSSINFIEVRFAIDGEQFQD